MRRKKANIHGLHMRDYTNLTNLLITNESKVPHFYLDTEGFVTIGIGHMVPDMDSAEQLHLIHNKTKELASPNDVSAEYVSVAQSDKGMVASFYKTLTDFHLDDDYMMELLLSDITSKEEGVRIQFAGYEAYPDCCKDALMDMAFNLGVNGLVTKFPKLKLAAEANDWSTCAEECHRQGISEERNAKTKDLFLTAIKV